MLQDFKAFIMRGNVIDMAVGIMIGMAFGAVVSSLVNDVIMSPIGLALGDVDFANLFVILKEGLTPGPYVSLADAQAAGAVTINYGVFINTVVYLLIIAAGRLLLNCASSRQDASSQKGRRTSGADNERMPLLLHLYSYSGRSLPELHFRT